MATKTRGNVIVEDIKVGDIHYEFELGLGIKCEVLTKPVRSETGFWSWQSKNLNTGKIIDYGVQEGFEYYSSRLYDHQAYSVVEWM